MNVTAPVDGGYVNAAASDPYTVKASAADAGTGVAQVDFYRSAPTASCSSGTDASSAPTRPELAGIYSALVDGPG